MKREALTNRKAFIGIALTTTVLNGITCSPASAGIRVYEQAGKYLEVGGRVQLQYHYHNQDNADTTDDLFFRRLRPYLEGSLHKGWLGKIQWDMGKAQDDDELSIKDAYLQYKALEFMDITVGNASFPFSREFLTSSKRQQLIERTFVGDHNYGVPYRNPGVHLTGHLMENQMLTWGASAASASIDPAADRLDFASPVNEDSDFNEGWIIGGRFDFHPLGRLKMAQGNFDRETKVTVGVATYYWTNDDDKNTHTAPDGVTSTDLDRPDIDSVMGIEVSGALRVVGLSIDAEINWFNAETTDPSVTRGLFVNGETDLETYAVEGGYMIVPERLELVGGFQMMEADNYQDEWVRYSTGANWFFQRHDIKLQATYRMSENVDGRGGVDADEVFIQSQYVF